MKKVFLLPSILLLAFAVQAQTKKTTKKVAQTKTTTTTSAGLKTTSDSLSYAFGISLGQYMKSQGISTCNFAMLNKAIDQTIKGQPTLLDMNQANHLMGRLVENKTKQVAAAEKAKGTQFLAKNKSRAGVMTTSSGLQYEILTKGTGAVPTRTDTVTAHYKGSLLDGKEFDNSYSRGEPLTIPVAGVIPGWTEALTLMPVGSKWKLYIPAEIGYGDYGAGQDIPGGATLVFEVELLGIANKKAL
ncbi:MAG: peptidylprolyl isomerase [Segetibacter sp.]|jgi:FKBP-type peptidyl-prolyl cis-trans isomerase|nr:peptidylprolyl isomerase [Segetibacter sp.]